MDKEFEIVHESTLNATPAQVFEALTSGNAGWLWPMEVEPRLGGAGPFGSVITAWDPPHHFANRMDGENGFFNSLDETITVTPEGKAFLRYVHSGVFFEDWNNQYDGATAHTEFYLHTLNQYVTHFAGRQASFTDVQGPAESGSTDAFEVLRKALGVDTVTAGDTVDVLLPGDGPTEAVLDFSNEHFIGLRTDNGLYRFFGRNAFGAVVGLTIHLFEADAEATNTGDAWQKWLDGLYA